MSNETLYNFIGNVLNRGNYETLKVRYIIYLNLEIIFPKYDYIMGY